MTTTDTAKDQAKDQAKAQLDSIIAMIERLEHAQTCKDIEECHPNGGYPDWGDETEIPNREEYHDEDAAHRAIQESPLSVLVRSGWYDPSKWPAPRKNGQYEDQIPVEYEILLCTGGPAVRIRGNLDNYGKPDTARLEYQDWGMPWTEYVTVNTNHGVMVRYAEHFYFGD